MTDHENIDFRTTSKSDTIVERCLGARGLVFSSTEGRGGGGDVRLCLGNPGIPQNGCRGFEIWNQLKEKTLESKACTDHRKGSFIQRQIYFLIKCRFFPLILSKMWFYKLMPVQHKRGLNVTIKFFHTAVLPPPSSPDPEKASRQFHSSLKQRLLNNAAYSGFQIVYFMTQQGVVL